MTFKVHPTHVYSYKYIDKMSYFTLDGANEGGESRMQKSMATTSASTSRSVKVNPILLKGVEMKDLFSLKSSKSSDGWLNLDATIPDEYYIRYRSGDEDDRGGEDNTYNNRMDKTIFPLDYMRQVHTILFGSQQSKELISYKIRFRFFHRVAIMGILFVIHLQHKHLIQPVEFDFLFDERVNLDDAQIGVYHRANVFSWDFIESLNLSYATNISVTDRIGTTILNMEKPARPTENNHVVDDYGFTHSPITLIVCKCTFPSIKDVNVFFKTADIYLTLMDESPDQRFTCPFNFQTEEGERYDRDHDCMMIAWLFCIMQCTNDGNSRKGVSLQCDLFRNVSKSHGDLPMILIRSLNLQSLVTMRSESPIYLFNGWITKLNCLFLDTNDITEILKSSLTEVNTLFIYTTLNREFFMECTLKILNKIKVNHLLYCVFLPDGKLSRMRHAPVIYNREVVIELQNQLLSKIDKIKTLKHFIWVDELYDQPFNDRMTFRDWYNDELHGSSWMGHLVSIRNKLGDLTKENVENPDQSDEFKQIYMDAYFKQANFGSFVNDRIYDERDYDPEDLRNIALNNTRFAVPIRIINQALIRPTRIISQFGWQSLEAMRGFTGLPNLNFGIIFHNLVHPHYLDFVNDTKNPLIIPSHIRNYEYFDQIPEYMLLYTPDQNVTNRFNPIVKFTDEDGALVHVGGVDEDGNGNFFPNFLTTLQPYQQGDPIPSGYAKKNFTPAEKVDFLIETIFKSTFFYEFLMQKVVPHYPLAQFQLLSVATIERLFQPWTTREMVDIYLAYFEQLVFSVDLTRKYHQERAFKVATYRQMQLYFDH